PRSPLRVTTYMESIVHHMQDEDMGVSVRTVKSFLSKVPSVFTGADIVHWLMKNLNIDEPAEALRLGSQLAAHGYFFPISDHLLTLKDDNTFYRFQTPYFWPSNLWEPENIDYAVFLCKRTLNNKARVDLADYEVESLTRLQRTYAFKWEFIVMQAESQARIDRKHDKMERKVTESQERAFWDVHRPLPGCVNTTDVDIKKSYRIKNPNRMRKVKATIIFFCFALEIIVKFLAIDLYHRSLLLCMFYHRSLISHSEQYADYDPFLTPPEPSNPWLSEDSAFWDLASRKEPSQQRVRRWGFSLDELLRDPMGRECFLKFLESEFSCENLQFWLAVQDLKSRPATEVPSLVEIIWREFLAPGAGNAINLDSHTFEHTAQNIKEDGRHSFDDAQEHIYMLMKNDSYARFLRSNAYQELFVTRKKVRLIVVVMTTDLLKDTKMKLCLQICTTQLASGEQNPCKDAEKLFTYTHTCKSWQDSFEVLALAFKLGSLDSNLHPSLNCYLVFAMQVEASMCVSSAHRWDVKPDYPSASTG
uniref:Regulator of G protein signaling 7 n=1 Tax=Eptatretus burgeri TaxID=7764 RepID=A0A8C4R2A6_EPTBU